MKRNLVTREELDAIARVNDDCKRLHVCPPPVTFVDMEVKNAAGELVDGFTMKSNSWIRNAYNYLLSILCGVPSNTGGTTYGAGKLALKRTAGTDDAGTNIYQPYDTSTGPWIGGSGSNAQGIVVGTGSTAESLDSHQLATIIASGNSSGQLAYNAQSATAAVYDSGTKKWTLTKTRVFNNNSGAAISVNEVGDIMRSGGGAYFMLTRDVLGTPVSVPNGGQLTVTYTIEMTFPG